jgi:TPR repeat protein
VTSIFNRLWRRPSEGEDLEPNDAQDSPEEECGEPGPDGAPSFATTTTEINAAGALSARETKETKTFFGELLKFAKALAYFVVAAFFGALLLLAAFYYGKAIGGRIVEVQVGNDTPRNYEAPMDWSRMPKWTNAADPAFLQTVESEANRFGGSAFDQLAMGLHERDNGDITKAYYYLTLAAARGQPYARSLRDQLLLTTQARDKALDDATQALFYGGAEADFLLGMLYLGDAAFELARKPDTNWCLYGISEVPREERTWPPCEQNFGLPGAARLPWPNDLLGDDGDDEKAYLSFARAAQCFHPEAPLWLNAMENSGRIDQATAKNLRSQASMQVQNGGKRDEFCNGGLWIKGKTGSATPTGVAGATAAAYCELEPGDGLQRAYRDHPGRSGYDHSKNQASQPLCTNADADTNYCDESAEALASADKARVCLRMGDAMLAAGDVDLALRYFRAAIARGRKYGAQASVIAGERMRALSTTCEYTTDSLLEIARGAPGANFIDLAHRQRALRAMGYYNGPIDNEYGPQTRDSVRRFQREIGFDETGALSPLETVLLICQAAETKSDRDSQNILGIMYAAGLGVVQNTDLAIEWLDRAARRSSAEAAYNLAIIYATGTILSSYRLCDIVENDQRAEAYYRDAQRLGHSQARNESFDAFKNRVVGEERTHLEQRGRSCGRKPSDTDRKQNQ